MYQKSIINAEIINLNNPTMFGCCSLGINAADILECRTFLATYRIDPNLRHRYEHHTDFILFCDLLTTEFTIEHILLLLKVRYSLHS